MGIRGSEVSEDPGTACKGGSGQLEDSCMNEMFYDDAGDPKLLLTTCNGLGLIRRSGYHLLA